jgi:hypothetical protein
MIGMWRAVFLGIALFICLLGLECMVMERMVLRGSGSSVGSGALDPDNPFALASTSAGRRTVEMADWHPWSLLSVGCVLTLYSLTLRKGGG